MFSLCMSSQCYPVKCFVYVVYGMMTYTFMFLGTVTGCSEWIKTIETSERKKNWVAIAKYTMDGGNVLIITDIDFENSYRQHFLYAKCI